MPEPSPEPLAQVARPLASLDELVEVELASLVMLREPKSPYTLNHIKGSPQYDLKYAPEVWGFWLPRLVIAWKPARLDVRLIYKSEIRVHMGARYLPQPTLSFL